MEFWRKRSGAIIAKINERETTSITLPVDADYLPLSENNMSLSVISGNLPKGMRLVNENIIGTPFEVEIETLYEFVIRAEVRGVYEDRTFKIQVSGPDDPTWITPQGLLAIGSNQRYFIIDSALIDFQLLADDPDAIVGKDLEYYLYSGELPKGLRLTTDGRIVGLVDPIIALEKGVTVDVVSDNGYDSWYYDTETFDLSIPARSPKKLNRYYEFIVSVTDGITVVNRNFEIYVVGDDFLRADNAIMQVANGVFSADNTFIRTPIWLTPSNLGYKRANNYLTLIFDTLDLNTTIGFVSYKLLDYNPDGSPSVLPENLKLDFSNGEIAGKIPYQQAVTRQYQFTLRASRQLPNYVEESYKDKTFTLNILGEVDSTITWNTDADLGTISTNFISTLSVQATTSVPNAIMIYNLESGKLPPGLRLGIKGEIIGIIKSFGSETELGVTTFDNGNLKLDQNSTTLDRTYIFTIKARDHLGYSAISRTFTLKILDPDNKIFSNIFAQPFLNTDFRRQFNELINNQTYFDYNYIYRPNDPNFGIQQKMKMLIYAGIETKDSSFYIAALSKNNKRKKYVLGKIKNAVAKQLGTQKIIYEVVYIDVIDPANSYENFNPTKKKFRIKKKTNTTVDQTSYDYDRFSVELPPPIGITIGTNEHGEVNHYFDPNFIVESRYGIKYLIDKKPIIINDVQIAGKLIEGPTEPYRFRPIPENTVKADFNGITVDGFNEQDRFISNIYHSRQEIKNIGETEIEYLPLWMRTAQQNTIKTLGYVTAIPLCYCLPGTSKEILTALNNANVSFSDYTFEIDRFVVDTIEGDASDQYLLFHNYSHNA